MDEDRRTAIRAALWVGGGTALAFLGLFRREFYDLLVPPESSTSSAITAAEGFALPHIGSYADYYFPPEDSPEVVVGTGNLWRVKGVAARRDGTGGVARYDTILHFVGKRGKNRIQGFELVALTAGTTQVGTPPPVEWRSPRRWTSPR